LGLGLRGELPTELKERGAVARGHRVGRKIEGLGDFTERLVTPDFERDDFTLVRFEPAECLLDVLGHEFFA